MMSVKCMRCNGCGEIADSADGEPWSMWLDLPIASGLAVILGIVKPIDCPDCKGAGEK